VLATDRSAAISRRRAIDLMIPRNIGAVLIGPRPLEGAGGVALLALRAESSRVHVVFRMTGTAHHGRLGGAQWLFMALRATNV
jgi:hypothetical protein